ncbi:MAG: exodeoxyribonuclease VII large subunit, partial [Eubacterium sp.]|nr:exodeoxyribonuclease VII large subunit [Eubacterium sp.]
MNVITVSQVNRYIKALLDESAPLRNIYISGEISNFKYYYSSGHMYFTLKDENSQLKAVMFSSYASKLRFQPDNGMKVICSGRISAYEKNGEYQLYVDDMQPDGIGALNLAFEQLKAKLFNEGVC